MSKGLSGLFHGTLGTSFVNGSSEVEKYADRGIDIPERIRNYLSHLQKKGDYITCSSAEFSMTDASIMSKEAGVEFAKVTIGNKAYIIRGDKTGTDIPEKLLKKVVKYDGRLDFHSHPFDDDLVPSVDDMDTMRFFRKYTSQTSSIIITTNHRTSSFNETGVVDVGTVPNTIDQSHKNALLELFGG